MDIGHHAVLVLPPVGEAGDVLKDPAGIGVEDMGTVPVDEHPGAVRTVVSVAADVVPPLQQEDAAAAPFREFPGGDAAGKPGADDDSIKRRHKRTSLSFCNERIIPKKQRGKKERNLNFP